MLPSTQPEDTQRRKRWEGKKKEEGDHQPSSATATARRKKATRAREVAAAVVLMETELRTSIGGVTLQGEDNDDACCSEHACLNEGLLVGFVGSCARLCALAPLRE